MVKNLRSFIHEKIPEDLRVDLDLISRRRDLRGEEKTEEVIKLFRKYEVGDFTQLGPGTNRYGLKLDGFVTKVATDKEGKIDNMKEFKMAKVLVHVPHTYEVSENGLLLTAEYVEPFQSYAEMLKYRDRIVEILNMWSSVYLIGDAGITSKNFANWGLRVGTEDVVCLDFAYVYDVSSDIFICRKCQAGSMLLPSKDFTKLICPNPACQKETSFEEIRSMISNEYHRKQIGDLSKEGYLMTQSNVLTELDTTRSGYLIRKRKGVLQKQDEEIDTVDAVDNEDNIKEENDMFKNELVINGLVGKLSTPYDHLVAGISTIEVNAEPVKQVESNTPDPQDYEDDNSEVAFSMPVDENAKDDVMELIGVPVSESDSHEEPDTSKFDRFKERFCNESNRAVSKMTGYIVEHLHANVDLFNMIGTTGLRVKKIYADQFYKNLSNSIFKAIVEYLEFDGIVVDNRNGEGTHKEYRANFTLVNDPDEFSDDQARLLATIERVYNTKGINSKPTLMEMIDEYNRIYADKYGSFDMGTDWISTAVEKMDKAVPMTPSGADELFAYIFSIWGDVEELAGDEEEETDEYADTDVDADDEGEDQYEDAPDEDESEESNSKYLRVDVFDNGNMDVVRIESDDSFGDISVPIYTNLSDAEDTADVVIDERNGCWDWMAHFVPDIMFRTENPDKYMSYNDQDWEIGGIHAVVIGSDEEGYTVIGLFALSGIFAIDDDYNHIPIHDGSFLNKLNTVIMNTFGDGTAVEISHRNISLSMTDFIHDEDYVNEFFVTVNSDDDDNEEDESSEESVDTTEKDPEVDDEESDEVVEDTEAPASDEMESDDPVVDSAVDNLLNQCGHTSDDTDEEFVEEGVKVTADIVNQIRDEIEPDNTTKALDAAITAIEQEEAALAALESVESPVQSRSSKNQRQRDERGRFTSDTIVPDPGDDDGTITPRRRRKK